MEISETREATRSSRLEKLIHLYAAGQTSDFLDRVLDKVFAQEAADAQEAVARLDADIAIYEAQYGMTSDDFHRRFKAGELGDQMDFIEWGSLIMMRDDLHQRLEVLTEKR